MINSGINFRCKKEINDLLDNFNPKNLLDDKIFWNSLRNYPEKI
jgi:hypothetical protein